MSSRKVAALVAVSVFVSLTACNSSNNNTVALSGAGSTFVNPAMSRWTADFSQAHANIHINYQSIGSGGGIQQVKAGTVDFGASDVALNDQQLAGMVSVVQIPESAGPVCITYNLPGLTQPLHSSADEFRAGGKRPPRTRNSGRAGPPRTRTRSGRHRREGRGGRRTEERDHRHPAGVAAGARRGEPAPAGRKQTENNGTYGGPPPRSPCTNGRPRYHQRVIAGGSEVTYADYQLVTKVAG